MYSEVLRLEVAPLGVKVITIMTGIVATNMFSNSPQDALPENSYYKVANEDIAVLASGEKFVGTAMPPAVYAKGVVNDVLGGHSGMTWRGKIASMGWFIHSYFPTWLTVSSLFVSAATQPMLTVLDGRIVVLVSVQAWRSCEIARAAVHIFLYDIQ